MKKEESRYGWTSGTEDSRGLSKMEREVNRKKKLTEEEQELYHCGEATMAVEIARWVLDGAPVEEMGPEEKKELERMKSMAEKAKVAFTEQNFCPKGGKGGVWLGFLENYFREILNNHKKIDSDIQGLCRMILRGRNSPDLGKRSKM